MTDEHSENAWMNWFRSLMVEPEAINKPGNEAELRELVRSCAEKGQHVRVVERGHSATGTLQTDDMLVNLEKLNGVTSHDIEAKKATLRAGTTLEQAGSDLLDVELGLRNFGDVAAQKVAGAIGTGTHGSGFEFRNLSSMLVGGRMVTASGDVREFSEQEDPELLRAARVALGTLGIFTEIRLDLVPSYKLERRVYCTNWEVVESHVVDLVVENRNFDFYWYPRSDEVKLRLLNPPGGGTDHAELADYATLIENQTGWAHQVIPKHNHIPRKFDEMEYAVPLGDGLECFRAVRDRVRKEWRDSVGWRVLWRTVAADDSYLSPAYNRDTATISLHQNAQLDSCEYFEDIEPIFHEFRGRPHWAKKHTLRAPKLSRLYPEWDRFQEIRRDMDPDGVFMNDYLSELFGQERSS